MRQKESAMKAKQRCADNGYGFLWMFGEEPIMFDDQKSVIHLRVKDHIPYLVTNYPENHAEDSSRRI